jgi:hypothetical protein
MEHQRAFPKARTKKILMKNGGKPAMVEENKINMQVSGKVLIQMPKFITKHFGKEGLDRWLEAISVEAHRVFIFSIKTSDWFPMQETLIKPLANIAQLFYNWDIKAAAWDLGRFSADASLKNVYKIFIKLGSTQLFFNKSSEFLTSSYRPCSVEIVDIKDNGGIFRITEFPEMDKAIEYRISGWVQRALEINGRKDIKIEIPKSITDFKPYSEFHVSWK